MSVSVTDPIGSALSRTGQILFRPFDIGKWFVLGFCAWLAWLGQTGGGGFGFGFGFQPGGLGGRGRGGPSFDPILHWLQDNLSLVILSVVVAFALFMALGLVVAWLRARGQFIFLDGVVRNRKAVAEPWHQFRQRANSVFWFRIVLGLLRLLAFIATLAAGLALALPDIRAERFGVWAILGIGVSLVLFLLWGLVFGLIEALLRDFVVPVMYLRNLRTMDAWRVFRREIAHGYFWEFVLFYLMKFVLGLAIGVIAMFAMSLTCCMAALPYIGTVILLPIYVFYRCYSLYFLQQFGPGWRLFYEEPAAPVPAAVGPGRPPPPP